MNKLKKVVSSQGFVNLLSSVFSILAGLLFGFLLLLVLNAPAALKGMNALLTEGLSGLNPFARCSTRPRP